MAPTQHQTEDGVLRLMRRAPAPQHRWTVRTYDTALKATPSHHKLLDHAYEAGLGRPEQYTFFALPRAAVHDGPNRIEVRLAAGPAAELVFVDAVLP
jgi:hypothetical protein